jgi:hypothetical protein
MSPAARTLGDRHDLVGLQGAGRRDFALEDHHAEDARDGDGNEQGEKRLSKD